MKKTIFLSFYFFLVITINSFGSHLMGGQITSKNIGNLTYEVTLTLFRDTMGIPISPIEYITYFQSNSTNTNPYDTVNNFNRTHFVDYHFIANIGNGVEKYEYIDTITFPRDGKYTATYTNCCRNEAILNMLVPNGESLYLDNQISTYDNNSSPIFLNDPITLAQDSVPFLYNPSPYDFDKDSLSWVLDTPLNGDNSQVAGYSLPPTYSSMPFQIDPVTGEISFLPSMLGNFQVSVKAIEWRNGVEIGYIRRDMQIIVVPCVNEPMIVNTATHFSRTQQDRTITLSPGDNFTLNLEVFDRDHDSIRVTTSGSAFLASNPATVVNNTPCQYNAALGYTSKTVSIEWTPSWSEVSDKPYFAVFRTVEKFGRYLFVKDLTFKIYVQETSTGVGEIQSNKNHGKILKTVDLMGREVESNSKGLIINQYEDGYTKKIFNQ